MAILIGVGAVAAGSVALAFLARREAASRRNQRARLFEACLGIFDEARIVQGGDGFPRLEGVIQGTRVVADLIPDTMTMRRLPQLWLSLTLLDGLPVEEGFAVLARPVGTEFYSLTQHYPLRLDPAPNLPTEILARGGDRDGQRLIREVAAPLAELFADVRTKEVAVTPRGLRIIHQAGQGERGPYLLLRQCVFADAMVKPGLLLQLFDGLMAIRDALPAVAGADQQ